MEIDAVLVVLHPAARRKRLTARGTNVPRVRGHAGLKLALWMGETRLLQSCAAETPEAIRLAASTIDLELTRSARFYDTASWDRIAAIEVWIDRAATESPDVFSRG
jgi:hypothetical protein